MQQVWDKVLSERKEIEQEIIIEPILKKFIDNKKDLWEALAFILASKIQHDTISETTLKELIEEKINKHTAIQTCILTDMKAYFNRDYACESYLEILLFFRGFQAITTYRIANILMDEGKKLTAKYIQNRIFETYGMDIHPKSKIGKGVVIDHGIGIVIGETAEIGDNAFIFHNVTLGGRGNESGNRHPKIRKNVFIGAGATLLGNIEIGENVNIAAGSVVVADVPPNKTAVGVPARVIGESKKMQ